jgi:hypothetical protein
VDVETLETIGPLHRKLAERYLREQPWAREDTAIAATAYQASQEQEKQDRGDEEFRRLMRKHFPLFQNYYDAFVRERAAGRYMRDAAGHEHKPPGPGGGQFTGPGGGGGGGTTAAPKGAHPKPRRLTTAKNPYKLSRIRDVGRRRKVIHALKNEGQLADAIGGFNLPDSEPADVIWISDAAGELVRDHARVKDVLRNREMAVQTLRSKTASEGMRAAAENVLTTPAHFFEVKTLLTQGGAGKIAMSKKAVARKQRWMDLYRVTFSTVAADDRKGRKHSGHRLYWKAGVGTTTLSAMVKVGDFGDILTRAGQ